MELKIPKENNKLSQISTLVPQLLKLLEPHLVPEEWTNLFTMKTVQQFQMMAQLWLICLTLSIQLQRLLLILLSHKTMKLETELLQSFCLLESCWKKVNNSLMRACILRSSSKVTEKLWTSALKEFRKFQSSLRIRNLKREKICWRSVQWQVWIQS